MKESPQDSKKYAYNTKKFRRSLFLTHGPILLFLLYVCIIGKQLDVFLPFWGIWMGSGFNFLGCCARWRDLYEEKYPDRDDKRTFEEKLFDYKVPFPRKVPNEQELNTWRLICLKWLFTLIAVIIYFYIDGFLKILSISSP